MLVPIFRLFPVSHYIVDYFHSLFRVSSFGELVDWFNAVPSVVQIIFGVGCLGALYMGLFFIRFLFEDRG